jgi:hypothetical protein
MYLPKKLERNFIEDGFSPLPVAQVERKQDLVALHPKLEQLLE